MNAEIDTPACGMNDSIKKECTTCVKCVTKKLQKGEFTREEGPYADAGLAVDENGINYSDTGELNRENFFLGCRYTGCACYLGKIEVTNEFQGELPNTSLREPKCLSSILYIYLGGIIGSWMLD